jgi:uncharacterized membrane protein YgdD (TMEM256/DUF423 family)
MIEALLLMLASLMGAGGVVLLAASAHAAKDAGLDSAGAMLLLHASAVIAAVAATGQGLIPRPLGLIAAGGLIIGAALFAGDLALRAFVGHRLFPMAAPTGGIVLIMSWLTLAGAALFRRGVRPPLS